MKIGIITDAIDDKAAGIGTYVRNLVSELLKVDKTNTYYLIHHSHSQDQFHTELKGNKRVHEIFVPIKRGIFGREMRKIVAMPGVLERYNLDVVHETAQTGPFFRKSNFKKIVTIHDLVPLIYPRTQSFAVHLHHRLGLPYMLKNVEKVIAVSENTKRDIVTLFHIDPNRVKVIYEAASPLFSRKSGHEIIKIKKKYGLHDYFFYVGALEPRKNIERMLRAFDTVRKSKNIQFVIVTKKGWKNQGIFRTIKELNLEHDIKILHDVALDELPSLYSGAKALVFASLYEGFGLPILEAMACGCPVITSKASCMPEVAGKAAILVNPENVDQIEKAMISVLDKKAADRLRTLGFKNVKRFSWSKAARETLKVYEEVAK